MCQIVRVNTGNTYYFLFEIYNLLFWNKFHNDQDWSKTENYGKVKGLIFKNIGA